MRSNFEIAITPSIVELERRTKAQNVGDSMAYRGIILNFQYNFQFNKLLRPQNGGHLKNRFILTSDTKKSLQIIPGKVFSMLMTSSVTSQRDVNVGLPYSCLNEITTFFTMTTKRIDI